MGSLSKPTIHQASLRAYDSAVVKGQEINAAEAEQRRKQGDDVVICGPDKDANSKLAESIEKNANGSYVRHPPHATSAKSKALPHYQPTQRPPEGHTFYETSSRKAV